MILSHKYKFIFIKPTKVAGTSIEINLAKHCGKEDIITPISEFSTDSDHDYYAQTVRNYQGYYNHIPSNEIKTKIGKKIWDDYYKFTVVRNPWDQTISRYFWEKTNRRNNFNNSLSNIKKDFLNPHKYLRSLKLFLEFFSFNFRKFIRNYDKEWTNTRFYLNSVAKPICDFYIRYEMLDSDYKKVCSNLGIPYEKLPRVKSKQRNNKKHYSKYFNKKTRSIINNLFKKDIDFFNYKFEKN